MTEDGEEIPGTRTRSGTAIDCFQRRINFQSGTGTELWLQTRLLVRAGRVGKVAVVPTSPCRRGSHRVADHHSDGEWREAVSEGEGRSVPIGPGAQVLAGSASAWLCFVSNAWLWRRESCSRRVTATRSARARGSAAAKALGSSVASPRRGPERMLR